MSKRIVVQLGRFGDMLLVMPMVKYWHDQGYEMHWLVGKQFSSLIDRLPYVKPVIWEGHHKAMPLAIHRAKSICDDVVVTQVDCNPVPWPNKCKNFVQECWERGGLWEKFQDLPLEFGFDNTPAEDKLCKQLGITGDRPVILTCFSGHSAPFHEPAEMRKAINAWSPHAQIVDLSDVRAARLYDLLGPMKKAVGLISVDTSVLHLAYAVNLPVLALTRAEEWYASERRNHWYGTLPYTIAATPACKQAVDEFILQVLPNVQTDQPLWHIADVFDFSTHMQRPQFETAMSTWKCCYDKHRNFQPRYHKSSGRSAKDIGDKPMPYLKDVFDAAVDGLADDAFLVYTNLDNCLVPETPTAVVQALQDGPCAFAARVDFKKFTKRYTLADLRKHTQHVGTDLFAFRAGWWRRVRDGLPDLLLGFEGWDFVVRETMLKHNPKARISQPLVYHLTHTTHWESGVNSLPGQVHNRKLAAAWATANGLASRIRPGDSYLFS